MASTDQPRQAVGSLGPRLPGRLTAELILRSPQYMSPIRQYELDLRGNKISAIENLGATENQFDSIDLSDNAIVRLEGFPRLLRLKQLLLNNNRLARITKGCHEPIPNLETLVLCNNKLANLQDMDPLAGFSKLTLLSLQGCPVVTRPNYRLYVISKCKALKVLDFQKVKQQEREAAAKLFPTDEAAAAHSAKTFDADADYEAQTAAAQAQAAAAQPAQPVAAAAAEPDTGTKKGPTSAQLIAIKAAIANAATMEEIRRLEEALTTGHLPSGIVIPHEPQQHTTPAPGAGGGAEETQQPTEAPDADMTDAANGGDVSAGGGGPAVPGAGQENGQAGEHQEDGAQPQAMAEG